MNTPRAELQLVPLPSDDGTIEKALADLDTKVTAWCGAISDAVAVIKNEATAQSALAGELTAREAALRPLEGPTDRAAQPPQEQPVDRAGLEDDQVEPTSPVQDQIETVQTGETVESIISSGSSDEIVEAVDPSAPETPVAELGDLMTEEPQASSEADLRQDEEALIATLDDDLARRVRVIRRLSPDKDLHGIIEQCRSAPTTPDSTKVDKKPWWRRNT